MANELQTKLTNYKKYIIEMVVKQLTTKKLKESEKNEKNNQNRLGESPKHER